MVTPVIVSWASVNAWAMPKSATLTRPPVLRQHVAGLDVAVHDAPRVRRIERIRDLLARCCAATVGGSGPRSRRAPARSPPVTSSITM